MPSRLLTVVVALAVLSGCGKKPVDQAALSPQDSMKTFQLSEDFRVELFLAEPEIVDPVEMAFDEDGRIYIAEMRDYPDDPPAGKPTRSRIRLLEDADGDGRYERTTIFADQVLQVSGLMPWKGGLLVTSAPDILFMKDSDGDGRADSRKVLFTGFPKVNSESRITNLRYGIDNWIYASNSGSDGKITQPDHPQRPPVLVRGADFRFRPDRGLSEAASGPAQYGSSFDDWGNRFISQNTVHIRHVVVPMQYLARAPLLSVPAVSQDISDHGRPSARMFQISKPQAWREARTSIRQHRHHENQTGQIERLSGYFTGATGGTIYTGDAWPEEYRGNVFTGDVAGNLVHRDIIVPDGPTFRAQRPKDGVEFLASTDIWFRPAQFANAPDGNLYMLDMYREFIETPESIPEAIKSGMNFWSGDDKGRIYRFVPRSPQAKRNLKPNLGKATTPELVQTLAHRNGWHRLTAQRLLVDRQDAAAVPLLRQMAQSHEFPLARLHALWTLEGQAALDPDGVLSALKDENAGIREHALRLSEPLLPRSREVADAVLSLAGDSSPRVQFQLALTLGYFLECGSPAAAFNGPKPCFGPRASMARASQSGSRAAALHTLARIAASNASDRWFRIAIASSVSDSAYTFFKHFQARRISWDAEFLSQLASLIGAKQNTAEISQFLGALQVLPNPDAGLRGLATGFRLANVAALRVPGADAALLRYLNSPSEDVQRAAWEAARYLELRALVAKASRDALDDRLPLEKRTVAVRALRGASFESVRNIAQRLFEASPPPQLQTTMIDALASHDAPEVGDVVLARWRSFSPEARETGLAALLNHRARVPLLLKAVEDGRIEAAEVNVAARARLLENTDPQIAKTAQRLFHDQTTDRARIVDAYGDVLKMAAEPARGKPVFEKNCARCHIQRRRDARVGPDLSGVNNKTKEELLTSILNPSYAIEARYTNYVVTTKEGRMYDGVIANETPHAITLRDGSDEGDEIILRKNIAEIRASRISLMPEDVEKSMSRQDLADLIAYLRAGL